MHSSLLPEIIEVIRRHFGLHVQEAQPVMRGYLNEKWILHTDRGMWFVKSYHPERYRNHLETIWHEIEQALQLQMIYYRRGGACPELLADEEGRCLHRTPSDRRFVLMKHCPGEHAEAGQVSESRMFALGRAAAMMHSCWNERDHRTAEVCLPSPVWSLDVKAIQADWDARWEKSRSASVETRSLLSLQREVLERLTPASVQQDRAGWAHLDLWVDNVLFNADRLSAIVDFDRVRYSYPAMDLGRAVLSCALGEGEFRRDSAAAFAEGYRTIRALPKDGLLHAVRHCWLIESFWWMRSASSSWDAAPRRFQQEMVWTAAAWDKLDSVLGHL